MLSVGGVVFLHSPPIIGGTPMQQDVDLFVGGARGYTCYRLPNLVQLKVRVVAPLPCSQHNYGARVVTHPWAHLFPPPLQEPGHVLAIAQGRKYDCSDGGWMDILIRRSSDGGKSWTPQALVYTESSSTAWCSVFCTRGCYWFSRLLASSERRRETNNMPLGTG
jgi:hypothetical protein